MKKLVTALLLTVSLPACAEETATSTLINNSGAEIGTIDVKQGPKGVLLDVNLENIPEGRHGFHIHRVGHCSDHDHFKSASGHITKQGQQHGLLNPAGPEYGDLPNLVVSETGKAQLELYAPDLKISGKGENVILDEDGSAFMIHVEPDNHITQPIGGAGARIACGVIKK